MFIALGAGVVAGITSQVFWEAIPDGPAPVSCAILSLVALALAGPGRLPGRRVRSLLFAASGVAIGVSWAAAVAGALVDSRLPAGREGEEFRLTVEVISMRQHADGSAGWTVAARALPWGQGCQLPGSQCRLRIDSWEPMPLSPGETWQLRLKLKRPHSTQNPGGADFERFLFGDRVVATGTIRHSDENRRLLPPSGFAAWRGWLLDATLPLLGDGPGDVAQDESRLFGRAVLPALVVDERSMMDAPQWRVLADTGTAHLVAISGLHVALLWGAILWAFALFSGRVVAAVRYERVALSTALVAAFVYAAIAGMPLPAQRAVLMLAVATGFLLWGGGIPVWRVWLAACLIVLLLDPLAVHAAGFWLSFGAVGQLLLMNDMHRRRVMAPGAASRVVREASLLVHMQWMITLLLAPLLIALFGSASLSSVLANLPAIPWVNLLALPPALLGMVLAPWFPVVADPLIDLAVGALAFLWEWLAWVDGLTWLRPVRIPAATPAGLWAMALALPVLLFSCRHLTRLAMLLLLVLCWPVPEPVPEGEVDACVLDVGQGLAVALRTASHAALYDTGPARGGSAEDTGAPILGVLQAFGVGTLDLLVLSHRDPEHVGAAFPVVRSFRPRFILAGEPAALPGSPARACDRDLAWRFDQVILRILPGDPDAKGNDRSCILQVDAAGRRLLVTGDIGRKRELALSARYGGALRSDVLVASSHGSRSASGPTFLAQVAPSWVVASSGYRNRFGYPSPEVRQRVEAMGARLLSTPESGAICMRLGPAGIVVRRQRETGRRYWRQ